MKKAFLNWMMLAGLALVLVGCGGSETVKDGDGAQVEDRGRVMGGGDGASTAGASSAGAFAGTPEDPNSVLYNKTLYFDFDRSEIREEYVELLRAHAEYLVGNPARVVTIEGHADERGSREYNIALGERRAKSVQAFFEAEGVDPGQITYISYGEERPAADGHSEAAWSKNRRAELVY